MNPARTLETVPSHKTSGFPSLFKEFDEPIFPSKIERSHDLFTEPNMGPEDTSGTRPFETNGGSGALNVSAASLVASPPSGPAVPVRWELFNAVQKWEGFVIEVGPETFLARLVRIKGEGPDQEAEIYLDEVAEPDQELIQPGAVFYWSIGYLDRPSGRMRSSIIRFRRQPAWTQRELEAARARARTLRGILHDENSP
ncbi:MAG: hypothetical protein AB1733_02510 [Thermodesulfobacteriota bacterium]